MFLPWILGINAFIEVLWQRQTKQLATVLLKTRFLVFGPDRTGIVHYMIVIVFNGLLMQLSVPQP